MTKQKKNTYSTSQKKAILTFLQIHKDDFLTVDEIKEGILTKGFNLSIVTIYRFLDKLIENNEVVKVSNPDDKKHIYRYIALDNNDLSNGKMICLNCGKILPLECTLLSEFYEHVQKEHGCELDYKKTVLYCICPDCLKTKQINQ